MSPTTSLSFSSLLKSPRDITGKNNGLNGDTGCGMRSAGVPACGFERRLAARSLARSPACVSFDPDRRAGTPGLPAGEDAHATWK